MDLRERPITRGAGPDGPASSGAGDAARARHDQATRFAAAGRAAIERALSTNSQTFLEQARQQGGE